MPRKYHLNTNIKNRDRSVPHLGKHLEGEGLRLETGPPWMLKAPEWQECHTENKAQWHWFGCMGRRGQAGNSHQGKADTQGGTSSSSSRASEPPWTWSNCLISQLGTLRPRENEAERKQHVEKSPGSKDRCTWKHLPNSKPSHEYRQLQERGTRGVTPENRGRGGCEPELNTHTSQTTGANQAAFRFHSLTLAWSLLARRVH